MKKRFAAFLLIVTAALMSVGCSSTWWADFQKDPVAQVQTFEQSAQSALAIADIAWNSVKPYLPTDILIKAQPRYDQAVLAVNKALVALTDAVQVAVEAQTAHPDFTKLIQGVSDAIAQVVAIINEFKATPPPATVAAGVPPKPAAPVGMDELNSAVSTMKHVGGIK